MNWKGRTGTVRYGTVKSLNADSGTVAQGRDTLLPTDTVQRYTLPVFFVPYPSSSAGLPTLPQFCFCDPNAQHNCLPHNKEYIYGRNQNADNIGGDYTI